MKVIGRVLFGLAALIAWASAACAQVSTSQVTVTPSASAYVSGYCLGGVLAVPNMVRVGGGTMGTIVVDVDIVDPTGSDATVDIFVFNQAPTGTYTDHANCTVAAADQPYLRGVIFGTSFTCALDEATTTGICRATPAQSLMQGGLSSTNLWFLPIIRSTPTYGSGKTLYFNFTAMPQ